MTQLLLVSLESLLIRQISQAAPEILYKNKIAKWVKSSSVIELSTSQNTKPTISMITSSSFTGLKGLAATLKAVFGDSLFFGLAGLVIVNHLTD